MSYGAVRGTLNPPCRLSKYAFKGNECGDREDESVKFRILGRVKPNFSKSRLPSVRLHSQTSHTPSWHLINWRYNHRVLHFRPDSLSSFAMALARQNEHSLAHSATQRRLYDKPRPDDLIAALFNCAPRERTDYDYSLSLNETR